MQPQYRNYPQGAQRSPHAPAQARRGPGPMIATPHAPPALTPQQIQAQQAQEAQRREMAKRQARKPTDKNMPDGLEDIVIGDGVQRYRSLREVERRLDAVMMRKRLDIEDSITRNWPRYGTMRIWISNTAEGQPWQQGSLDADAFDFSSESNATYRVKIEGRLLDDEEENPSDSDARKSDTQKDPDAMEQDGDEAKKKQKGPTPYQRTKLSHFFKSITIDFDRSKALQPDGFTQIEWKKEAGPNNLANTNPDANFDCLEFERKSDENINVTINLVCDEYPERYKLSKPLADLLDTDEDDRAGVMMRIWSYVKAMNLQEDEDARKIICDNRLKAVFNTDTVSFPDLPNLIGPHLNPLPPLQLSYTIRVDKAYILPPAGTTPSAPTIYDVLVPLDDPYRTSLIRVARSTTPSHLATLQNIAAYDEQLALSVQAVAHAKAKHAFFSSMSRDPANFIKRWTSSQRRDLQVILGESGRGIDEGYGEEWRRSDIWKSETARESVGLWLARQKVH